MRMLVIDAEAKLKAMNILEYASKPEHFFIVGPGGVLPFPQTRPGENPNLTVYLNTYRCVFSFTKETATGKVYRHLSVSVPSGKYPNPFAVYEIATLFGFTGWDGVSEKPPEGWGGKVDEEDHCIQLIQMLGA
jgi:hypothetical protein